MDLLHLLQMLTFYLSKTLLLLRSMLFGFPTLAQVFVKLSYIILSLNFRLCNLSPSTIDLDNQTTMHFWTTNHRQFNKPNLVLIHGFGGNSTRQFSHQVWSLSQCFNLYIPDLLFFGKSYTNRTNRSDIFQAKCVMEGLKRLGVDRFSVFGISYGGFVAYQMAEIYRDEIEKVVIVSSGIGYSDGQKEEQLRRIGRNMLNLLLPETTEELRCMVNMCIYKFDPFKWVPDFILRSLIKVMYKDHRKEKIELAEYLLEKETDSNLPILTQESLLIWGDKDNVFPVELGNQLQRHLGPKSRLEIIKDTGHAANIESPDAVNSLIKSFVLGTPNMMYSINKLFKGSRCSS